MRSNSRAGSGSRLRSTARRLPGARALVRLLRRLLLPHHREIHRLKRDEANRLFQPYPTTAEERYPPLFDRLAACLSDLSEPRILSFGCSTGEEVRALRRRLPNARIVGIDLNRRAIARARAADPGALSEYRCDGAPRDGERFDAVLAMAVFRHGDLEYHRPDSCAKILPFARFATGLAMLDRALEPGGWLALYNQQFRLADTPLAAHYDVDPLSLAPLTLLYDADNRRIDDASETNALFRKLAKA